jgi:hypothetical protein
LVQTPSARSHFFIFPREFFKFTLSPARAGPAGLRQGSRPPQPKAPPAPRHRTAARVVAARFLRQRQQDIRSDIY